MRDNFPSNPHEFDPKIKNKNPQSPVPIFKLGFLSCVFLIPTAVLVGCLSPSYAIETFAQAPNPQGDPNRDRLPQPAPIPEPLSPQPQPELQKPPVPETSPAPAAVTIEVKEIQVEGSTIFTAADWNQYTQPKIGQKVTLAELQEVANQITQLYLKRGYITSRAILAAQTITDSVVKIQVIEGSLEKIDIQGITRLNPEYVRSRISLGAGTPLSTIKLEDQLRLLRSDPLFANVEASLRPGSSEGKSILRVRVTEAKSFNTALSIDNYSPPSVGSERLGISSVYRNLTGLGDELAASYYRTTTGGSNLYDFSYRVPLNAMNGTLQLRTTINNNKVTESPFEVLDIRGESELYEISYRQPIVRSLAEEFALSLAFAVQNGQTFLFGQPSRFDSGPDAEGNSRTRVIKFGQDYVKRDLQGAWALRSQFSFGTGLFDATINVDPTPDGNFFSWLGQVQRVQNLDENNRLIIQADVQLTPNGLLSSQQFVIGGGQSVRGYRQNVRAGDNGFRLSLEDQITVSRDQGKNPVLQLAPFFDLGVVWNVDDNPNRLLKQNLLASTGLGVIWKPAPNFNLRLDYGLGLVKLDDKGDNTQDNGFYFSLGYRL